MFKDKKVGFVLFSTLFVLLLIPGVFALFEALYGLTYEPFDIVSFYINWQTWIDFILFFMLFSSLGRMVFGKMFGSKDAEGENPGLKAMYISLGAILSLGLVLLERQNGWSLLQVGPLSTIIFILFLVVLGYFIYSLISGKETKMSLGKIIFFMLLTLLIASLLFPTIFGPILDFLLSIPLVKLLLFILLIMGLIFFLGWLFGGIGEKIKGFNFNRNRRGSSSTNNKTRQENGGNGRRPDEKTPKEPKEKKIRVNILLYPDKKPYSIGSTINLIANIERKKGWFGWGSANGRFACSWYVNGLEVNNKNTNITFTIPQDMINQPSKKMEILVSVLDLDSNMQAKDSRTIEITANLPELIITNPIDTRRKRNLSAKIGENLNFSYIFEKSGAVPQSVADVRWSYIRGNAKKDIINNIKNATSITVGNHLQLTIGRAPLDLKEGKYTIICAAINEKGSYYQLPGNNGLLADNFSLEVKKGKSLPEEPEPPTNPEEPEPPVEPGEKPEFIVNVFDTEGNPLNSGKADFKIDSKTDNTLIFEPAVTNAEISDYSIEIKETNSKGDIFQINKKVSPPKVLWKFKNPGEKTISFIFKNNNKKKLGLFKKTEGVIKITISVSGNKVLPGEKPEFMIKVKYRSSVTQYPEDFTIQGDTNDVFDISPIIKNDDINNYEITWDRNIDENDPYSIGLSDSGSSFIIETKKPGKKTITCIFRKNSKVKKKIKLTLIILEGAPVQKAKFLLEIKDPQGAKLIVADQEKVEAYVGETLNLKPIIEEDDPKFYSIEWADENLDRSDNFPISQKDGSVNINFNEMGENKKVICIFKDRKNNSIVKKIIVVFKVEDISPITIIKPKTREESKKNPIIIKHGEPLNLQCRAGKNISIEWNLQANHKDQASTDTIRILGREGKIIAVFSEKFPNMLPEGEYTIFAYAYNNKKLIGIDYIWINLISNDKKPKGEIQPEIFLFKQEENGASKLIKKFTGNFDLEANIGELYIFTPKIENDSIINYNISFSSNNTKKDIVELMKDKKSFMLGINNPGKKEITCTFENKQNNKKLSITATVNAKGKKDNIPRIIISKINELPGKTNTTYPLLLDKEAKFEAEIVGGEIEEIIWYVEEADQKPKPIGRGLQIKYNFGRRDYGAKEYGLIAVAFNNNEAVQHNKNPVIDKIKIKLVGISIPGEFKEDIEELKNITGKELEELINLRDNINQKNGKEITKNVNKFTKLETSLQTAVEKIKARADKLNDETIKAGILQKMNEINRYKISYWVNKINDYAKNKEYKLAEETINAQLNSDTKKIGMFIMRLNIVNELHIA